MAKTNSNNITTSDDLVKFLMDQHEKTGQHFFLVAANSILLYERDVSLADFTVEHKQATWLISSDGYYPYCSNCNQEPKSGKMEEKCPSCGAIMTKETKERG